MKTYRVGWTFKNFNAQDSDYTWFDVQAYNEKDACGRLSHYVDNHMARISCRGVVESKMYGAPIMQRSI